MCCAMDLGFLHSAGFYGPHLIFLNFFKILFFLLNCHNNWIVLPFNNTYSKILCKNIWVQFCNNPAYWERVIRVPGQDLNACPSSVFGQQLRHLLKVVSCTVTGVYVLVRDFCYSHRLTLILPSYITPLFFSNELYIN